MRQTVTNTDRLQRAVDQYLRWMASVGYSRQSLCNYRCQLRHWSRFVTANDIAWQQMFTIDTLSAFKRTGKRKTVSAVYGLARYLFAQNRIPSPIGRKHWNLPEPYASYLQYRRDHHPVDPKYSTYIHRICARLDQWLEKEKIDLKDLTIAQVDTFLADFNRPLALGTRRLYRSCLRGFLTYMHQQDCLKKDLAPLVVGPAAYALAKPPKFLRPSEIKRLFDAVCLDTATDLRTGAMLHLAFTLGLRPSEICRIKLDDIHFRAAELTLAERKNYHPIRLPVTDGTLKAIVAYVIGPRPQCSHRMLFANHLTPYGPVRPNTVCHYIGALMRKAGLEAKAYWLRHSYAQNLLENGASIYEIKEMMGHDTIQSSQRYLHIHTKLMRKVIFDEDV